VGTAALFEALPRLSCLKELYLDLDRLDLSIDPQQFSVLTASSQLTSLDLFRDDAMPIPQKALQHMLPPGQQLQFLEELTISATPGENKYFDVDAWCLNSADLLRIAEACPRLRWLRIINTVQPGADLSPLLQLSRSCTILEVGGQAFTDAAVPLLLQLTQLEDLSWNQSPRFTDVGLEQLTRLDLTQLLIGKCGLSYQVCPYNSSLVLKQDPMLVSALLGGQPCIDLYVSVHIIRTRACALQKNLWGRFCGLRRACRMPHCWYCWRICFSMSSVCLDFVLQRQSCRAHYADSCGCC
jgi:hypothetical protein